MKIVSFSTMVISDERPYDLNIFLQFTDEEYNKWLLPPARSPQEFLEEGIELCSNYWNMAPYSENDELTLDGSVFEHISGNYITPIFEW
jgi:hypothetical protein